MKKLAITLFAIIFGMTAFSQVNQDFETGNRATYKNDCWYFSQTNVNASNELQGKYALHTGSLSNGTHILISPWVKFTTAGELTFSTKMSADNGSSRKLKVYLLDLSGKVFETVYEYDYPGVKTKVVNAVISLKLTGVYRVKWEFTGEGGSSKGMLDEISIPGEYFSDPSANDGTGDCQVLPIPVEKDSDSDGPGDNREDYPEDETRAYDIKYPATEAGTLAFEDLWPSKGDYDFNDLVVDYQCQIVTDSKNEIVEIKASFTTRAIGAGFHNAFALQLDNIPAASVIRVTNSLKNAVSGSTFKIMSNGVEAGQKYATVVIFDNAYKVLPHAGTVTGVNTTIGAPYVTPTKVDVVITLKENGKSVGDAIKFLEWPIRNINLFIVAKADQGRGIEIHLPDYQPTDLADRSLFGTGNDASIPESSVTYRSVDHLPWALDLPVSFAYPIEKSDIVKAYLMFGPWAESGGQKYADWYLDKGGYRNSGLIYKH